MSQNSEKNRRTIPEYFRKGSVFLGHSVVSRIATISLINVFILAIAYAVIFPGYHHEIVPVKQAVGWDTLRIDGNRNEEFVLFKHRVHQDTIGTTREKCRTCHHVSLPNDGPSACSSCHRDMVYNGSIFKHEYHQRILGDTRSCQECHANQDKSKEEVKKCSECHENYKDDMTFEAKGYLLAMHTRCQECHKERDTKAGGVEKHAACINCHREEGNLKDRLEKITQFDITN